MRQPARAPLQETSNYGARLSSVDPILPHLCNGLACAARRPSAALYSPALAAWRAPGPPPPAPRPPLPARPVAGLCLDGSCQSRPSAPCKRSRSAWAGARSGGEQRWVPRAQAFDDRGATGAHTHACACTSREPHLDTRKHVHVDTHTSLLTSTWSNTTPPPSTFFLPTDFLAASICRLATSMRVAISSSLSVSHALSRLLYSSRETGAKKIDRQSMLASCKARTSSGGVREQHGPASVEAPTCACHQAHTHSDTRHCA